VALSADNIATIPALLAQYAVTHPREVVLRNKQRGIWVSVTWVDLTVRVQQIGMALMASGLAQGDVVAVLSDTRPEAVCADLGALAAGCVSACVGAQDDLERTEQLLRSTGCRLLFVENEEQLDKALMLRDRCPELRQIIIFDMKGLHDLDDVMCESLSAFLARGVAHDSANPTIWKEVTRSVTPEHQAALVQATVADATMQTLTQGNIVQLAEQVADRLGQRPGDERVAFLPMSGTMERVLGLYAALAARTVSNYLENAATLIENLREVQPTVLAAPLSVWDQFRQRIVAEAANATLLQRTLFTWAVNIGESTQGNGLLAWIVRRLVLGSVRQNMGLARLRVACTGTIVPPHDLARWYRALGISLRALDSLVIPDVIGEQHHQSRANAFTCAA
jgi:long-chain acyl-CoA synthetase